ncbi:hypothetical protein BGZ50_003978 [Haplosporangium sp. Z 11]|nr:hypothetical protein BGZ50_003978 [Haplosporangium sp. Z 11]
MASNTNAKNIKKLAYGGSAAKLAVTDSVKRVPSSATLTSNAAGSISGSPLDNAVVAEVMASSDHVGEASAAEGAQWTTLSCHANNAFFPDANIALTTFDANKQFTSQISAQDLLSVDGSADDSVPMTAPTKSSMELDGTLPATSTDSPIHAMVIDEDAYMVPTSLMDGDMAWSNRVEQRQWPMLAGNDVFMEGIEQAPQIPVSGPTNFTTMAWMGSTAMEEWPTSHLEMDELYPEITCSDWSGLSANQRSSTASERPREAKHFNADVPIASYNVEGSLDRTPILLSQNSKPLTGAPTILYPPPCGPQYFKLTPDNTPMNDQVQTFLSSMLPGSFVFSPVSTVRPADIMLGPFNSTGLDSVAMEGSTTRSMAHGTATGPTYGAAADEMGVGEYAFSRKTETDGIRDDKNGEGFSGFNGDCEDQNDDEDEEEEEEEEGEEETDQGYHEGNDGGDDSNDPDYGSPASVLRVSCPVPGCTSDYSTKWNIKDHIARHHRDDYKFECTVAGCARPFKTERDMKRHVRERHEGLKPHQCPKCFKAFTRPYKMTKHVEKMHSSEPLPVKEPSKKRKE